MLANLGAINVVTTSHRQIEFDPAGVGDAHERIETGRIVSTFPSGDHRLWLAHPLRKLTLGQAGSGAHAADNVSTIVGP
jgi:hypothetical protein